MNKILIYELFKSLHSVYFTQRSDFHSQGLIKALKHTKLNHFCTFLHLWTGGTVVLTAVELSQGAEAIKGGGGLIWVPLVDLTHLIAAFEQPLPADLSHETLFYTGFSHLCVSAR